MYVASFDKQLNSVPQNRQLAQIEEEATQLTDVRQVCTSVWAHRNSRCRCVLPTSPPSRGGMERCPWLAFFYFLSLQVGFIKKKRVKCWKNMLSISVITTYTVSGTNGSFSLFHFGCYHDTQCQDVLSCFFGLLPDIAENCQPVILFAYSV